MSPVGHTLTGLSIGYGFLPWDSSKSQHVAWLATSAIFANAPDWPLPYWGHDRYDISHSIFSTIVGIAVFVTFARTVPALRLRVPMRIAITAALAWLSHLLLDTFYNHGNGLAVFWPISDARIALPIAWFSTLQLPPIVSKHNLRVMLIEAIAYGLVLACVVVARRMFVRGSVPEAR